MVFNSALFAVFFLGVFIFYFFGSRTRTQRLSILIAANLIFYGSWDIRFIPWLLIVAVADFLIGNRLGSLTPDAHQAERKALLGASVAVNMGVLIAFKYSGFVLEGHSLIAPLGISFFTFQGLSYTIDVYREVYKPKETLLEFLAGFTFFPHLLAGPIIRSSFLFPQFRKLEPPAREDNWRCLNLIAAGLFKKTTADLVIPVVARAFSTPHPYGAVCSWSSVLGFAAQLYGDFSGYTDMATGLALLLGFQLPRNFNLPYLSASPGEFWRRWHISLSLWFRDYLYFPLALGALRKHPYLNLFFVMFLAGVWHGASLNCVFFGVYHGLLLVAAQWLSIRHVVLPIPRYLKIAGTFLLILVGQVLFRAPTLESALGVYQGMFGFGYGGENLNTRMTLSWMVAILVLGHVVDAWVQSQSKLQLEPKAKTGFVAPWVFATGAAMLALIVNVKATFIYFAF